MILEQYQFLVGKTDADDDKIFRNVFHDVTTKDMQQLRDLKRLSLDIVFKYLKENSFRTIFQRLEVIAKEEKQKRLIHLNNHSDFTLKQRTKEVQSAYETMKRTIKTIGLGIFQFLRNQEEFLKNQNPEDLSFSYPFIVKLDYVQSRLTARIREKILQGIYREDEFKVRISAFRSTARGQEQLLRAVQSALSSLPSFANHEALESWIDSIAVISKCYRPTFKKALKDYIASNNPFSTTSEELSRFLSINSSTADESDDEEQTNESDEEKEEDEMSKKETTEDEEEEKQHDEERERNV